MVDAWAKMWPPTGLRPSAPAKRAFAPGSLWTWLVCVRKKRGLLAASRGLLVVEIGSMTEQITINTHTLNSVTERDVNSD